MALALIINRGLRIARLLILAVLAKWCLNVIRNYSRLRKYSTKFPAALEISGLTSLELWFGYIPEFLKNYARFYDHRMQLFNDAGKKLGKKIDTLYLPAPFFSDETFFITRDPKLVKHILKDDFDSWVKPEFLREELRVFLGNGIFVVNHGSTTPEDKLWTFQRKTAAKIFTKNAFTGHVYDALSTNTDKCINIIKKSISSNTGKGCINMKQMVYCFTMDSIGDIGFGIDLNTLNEKDIVPFSKSFDQITQDTGARFLTPFWEYFPWLYPSEQRIARDSKILKDFCKKVIKDRQSEKDFASKGDILSLFMEADSSLSQEMLYDIIMSFMIAGRDTTACTLTFLFFLLATHQEVQLKVQQEIDAVHRENLESKSEQEERMTMDKLHSMPFLHAVILETLRLFPPVPTDVKAAAKQTTLHDGTVVPKQTVVAFEPFVMGRDEARYDNAKSFEPERWLRKNQGSLGFDQYLFPVFQAGPRICLGKDLAFYEIKMLSAELLRRFRFSLPMSNMPRDMNEFKADVASIDGKPIYQPGLTLSFLGELELEVEARE